MLFVDFKQAFDSMRWIKIYETLRDSGIPLKFIKLTKEIYEPQIKYENKLKESVLFYKEVKQSGCRPPFILLHYAMPLKTLINEERF